MRQLFQQAGLRLVRLIDAERAHALTLSMLSRGYIGGARLARSPLIAQTVAGLPFPSPLGIAAGFDKNGEVAEPLFNLGFGFVEVGTTTPLPQPGNPKPRIFRLNADQAVINRLGFNNDGHAAMLENLNQLSTRPGPLGINVGANKDSDDRIADYVAGIKRFAPHADYFTVNISSPNTPGLRDLQHRSDLAALLQRVLETREAAVQGRLPPVFVKIAPDLSKADLADVVDVILELKVDGLIVSNTTLERPGLASTQQRQAGGLSGRPLFQRSTIVLAHTRRLAGPDLPIIAVGGIDSGEAAWTKIRAGANLLQLYTGLVYRGPQLIAEITRSLEQHLQAEGYPHIAAAVGTANADWAAKTYPAAPTPG